MKLAISACLVAATIWAQPAAPAFEVASIKASDDLSGHSGVHTTPGFLRVHASFGFMQRPDVMRVLRDLPPEKLNLDWDRLAFYLPEAVIVAKGGWWRQRIQQIFEFMGRNSLSQAKYLCVQPGEIIHVGVKLEM